MTMNFHRCYVCVWGIWFTAWSVDKNMFGFGIDVIKDLSFMRVGAGIIICNGIIICEESGISGTVE